MAISDVHKCKILFVYKARLLKIFIIIIIRISIK